MDGKDVAEAIGIADDYQDADGETILDYAQAQEKAKDCFAKIGRHGNAPGRKGPFTVADALDAYIKDRENRGFKTVRTARIVMAAWVLSPIPRRDGSVAQPLGDIKVEKLGLSRLEAWLADMTDCPRRLRTGRHADGQKYAPRPATEDEVRARKSTANRTLAILRAALNFARERRMTSAAPVWNMVRPHREAESARHRFLDRAEMVRLVNVCNGAFKSLVQGALLTGCRYSELARLQCRDYLPGEVPMVFIARSKSGRSRHVILNDDGAALFDGLTAGRGPDDLIFTHQRPKQRKKGGNPCAWESNDHHKPMVAACKAAEIKGLTFHGLRHTYASTLLNNGATMFFVAEQLGHTSTAMAEKHYGHINKQAQAAALRAAMPSIGLVERAPTTIAKLNITKEPAKEKVVKVKVITGA